MRVFKKQFYAASLRKQRFRKLGKSELQEVILTPHFGSMFWKGYAIFISIMRQLYFCAPVYL